MPLSRGDYESLLGTIAELHECANAGALAQRSPHLIARLIPCEYCAVFETSVGTPPALRIERVWETEPRMDAPQFDRMVEHFPTHPFTIAWAEGAGSEALRLADFYSDRQLRRTALYQELYRPGGIWRNLAVGAMLGPRALMLTANRGPRERDFSERDRAMLSRVLPHFLQAHRTSERGAPRRPDVPRLRDLGLTAREAEVACWVAMGKTNPEIAVILAMNPRTVEKHVERVLEKLGVENRTAAALVINGL